MRVRVGRELLVGSLLNHLALVDHEEPLAVPDRAQPVRNDDRCAAFHCSVECLLHDLLTLFVEGAGGLVEDENLWVLN